MPHNAKQHAMSKNIHARHAYPYNLVPFFLLAPALAIFRDDIFRGGNHGARRKMYLLRDWSLYIFLLVPDSIFAVHARIQLV